MPVGRRARLKIAKEPVEKHRLEPCFRRKKKRKILIIGFKSEKWPEKI